VSTAKPKEVPVAKDGKEVPEGYHVAPSGRVIKNRDPASYHRKNKVKNDTPMQPADVLREDLAGLLTNTTMGIHAMLAEVVDPRCALQPEQARIEGEAIARIMEQYSLDPSGKFTPWLVLVGTLLLCETPTAMVIAGKVKNARSGRTQRGEIVEGVIEGVEVVP
jgi:hypothetical protein